MNALPAIVSMILFGAAPVPEPVPVPVPETVVPPEPEPLPDAPSAEEPTV